MGRPQINEKRFYLYPTKRVAAVLEDEEQCSNACHDLEKAGIDLSDVNLLSGSEGQQLLSRGRSRGLLGGFVRWLQHWGYERTTLEMHNDALRHGKWLIFVPARNNKEAGRVIEILRAHSAAEVFHFRHWAVQYFPPKYQLKP
ncbi:hypothetical protein [Streptomyces bauhiniae]|uniref:hypothetical protein n=1 Tax=Streptomyces bauhiniae TaxID=2340725 RepID=UPI00365319E5